MSFCCSTIRKLKKVSALGIKSYSCYLYSILGIRVCNLNDLLLHYISNIKYPRDQNTLSWLNHILQARIDKPTLLVLLVYVLVNFLEKIRKTWEKINNTQMIRYIIFQFDTKNFKSILSLQIFGFFVKDAYVRLFNVYWITSCALSPVTTLRFILDVFLNNQTRRKV